MEKLIKEIILKNSFPEIDNDGVGCRSVATEKIDEMVTAITNELTKDFETASRVLIKYLCEHHHPMVRAIIDSSSCELLEGIESHPKIYDYVRD